MAVWEGRGTEMIRRAAARHGLAGEVMVMFYSQDNLYCGIASIEHEDRQFCLLKQGYTPELVVNNFLERQNRRGKPIPPIIADNRAAAAVRADYAAEMPSSRLIAREDNHFEIYVEDFLQEEDTARVEKRKDEMVRMLCQHYCLPDKFFLLQLDEPTSLYLGTILRHEWTNECYRLRDVYLCRQQAADLGDLAMNIAENDPMPILCERRHAEAMFASLHTIPDGDHRTIVCCGDQKLEVYSVQDLVIPR